LEKTSKIIVIDNYKDLATTYASILQKSGYTADTAQTGKEALEKAHTNHYAVAIIDAEIPDSTRILQNLAKTKTIKIVITDFPEETILKGADACLTKIVKPKDLLFLIEKMLKEKQTTNH
jgi:DNA-binding response OmpR family regulator